MVTNPRAIRAYTEPITIPVTRSWSQLVMVPHSCAAVLTAIHPITTDACTAQESSPLHQPRRPALSGTALDNTLGH